MQLVRDLVAHTGGALCLGCGRVGSPLCRACSPAGIHRFSVPPDVAVALARWSYDGPIRQLILDLKLRGARASIDPLVRGLREAAIGGRLSGRVITWVPGRRSDIRRRGFDHAEVLARGLGAELGLPARPILSRIAVAPDQSGLSAAQRLVNLKGVFDALHCPERVVLVDDVITTGATLVACAAALKQSGGLAIEALVVARTMSQ
jgi:ComF family protein